jgi:hypothetical protein
MFRQGNGAEHFKKEALNPVINEKRLFELTNLFFSLIEKVMIYGFIFCKKENTNPVSEALCSATSII